MEQDWYLFPGQTLENTKIKDRGKALKVTSETWTKFTNYLKRKEFQQEIVDKERAHHRYLKDVSANMMKNWDDSIEKIRQRQIEEPYRKMREREEGLVRRYMELTSDQAKERAVIVSNAKKQQYMKSEKTIQINNALLLTEVLYERKLQEEFNAKQREKDNIEEAKYAQEVKHNAQQYKLDQETEKRKNRKVKHKCHETLTKQMKENEQKIKQDREKKYQAEIEDNKRASEEMKDINEYEKLLGKKHKDDIKQQVQNMLEEHANFKEDLKNIDIRENQIVNIYAQSKCRLDEMKKSKLEQFENERIRIREKIAMSVMAKAQSFKEEEERILAKAIKEREDRETKKVQLEEAYQKRLREEREENHNLVLKQIEKEKGKNLERIKWEMANRLKLNEVITKKEQEKAQRLFDEKIQYRRDLDVQNKADEDRVKYEEEIKEAEFRLYKDNLANDDKAFFGYSDEVLDLAKSRGRSLDPILKVIEKYKVDNRLVPNKKKLSLPKTKVLSLKEKK